MLTVILATADPVNVGPEDVEVAVLVVDELIVIEVAVVEVLASVLVFVSVDEVDDCEDAPWPGVAWLVVLELVQIRLLMALSPVGELWPVESWLLVV